MTEVKGIVFIIFICAIKFVGLVLLQLPRQGYQEVKFQLKVTMDPINVQRSPLFSTVFFFSMTVYCVICCSCWALSGETLLNNLIFFYRSLNHGQRLFSDTC